MNMAMDITSALQSCSLLTAGDDNVSENSKTSSGSRAGGGVMHSGTIKVGGQMHWSNSSSDFRRLSVPNGPLLRSYRKK